ncbi:MAG: hypothetical protein AB1Z98_29290 [Nannocystaceae bacterium]
MKKVSVSKQAVERAIAALDEVETGVLGSTTGRVRTDVKAGVGADTDKCKPWMCPRPLYGVPTGVPM